MRRRLWYVTHIALAQGNMDALVDTLILEELLRFKDEIPVKLSYGTAGFRDRAERLDRIVFRMGVLAAMRSKVIGGICKILCL